MGWRDWSTVKRIGVALAEDLHGSSRPSVTTVLKDSATFWPL